MINQFEIKKHRVSIPLLVHIPHSSTYIPPEMKAKFLLSDNDLQNELLRMTDLYTDEIFSCVAELGGISVMYNYSRLVLDPERFRNDNKEEMAKQGMGVIYIKDSNGRKLREISEKERNLLLQNIYDPYHKAIAKEVQELLVKFGECLIIDAHSFPAIPLPYENSQDNKRPQICIGTDPYHTPEDLVQLIQNFFEGINLTTEINKPFPGCYVPLTFLHQERRVKSIMIEINRDLYMNEDTGEKNNSFTEIRSIIRRLINQIIVKFF
ncbi:MAG: N-formylglutamate amidohydrolase [Candidatus Lokiarchaeota archaeon]|nr:N-formylglutamate amidohydrolase [Candidatus Lokiarchaeota archaeon]